MPSPMFNRQPLCPSANVAGKVLKSYPTVGTPLTQLIGAPSEATLVEEVRFCVSPWGTGTLIDPNTDAGDIMLYLAGSTIAADNTTYLVGVYPVPAGASDYVSGEIELDLCLGVGSYLYAVHSVQKNGAGGYVVLNMTALGGIVR